MAGTGDNLATAINIVFTQKLFAFTAQRYSIGKSHHGRSDRLLPNASNLAQVLAVLQGEQGDVFRKLVGHLRDVISTIGNLSVTTLPSQFEIRVWPTEARERPELSFGLDDSGTGVAQVLAILTVMMTMDEAVIVIDEIRSFLHPAATKALLRIMQTEYPQHQYIISTHSSDVISSGNPSSVYMIRKDCFASSIERVDLKKVDQLHGVADLLGVSMTDVFAAERVIWVEGPTEALCFPFIYSEKCGSLPRGLLIAPVVATGDFFAKTKRRELVFDVYRRLSEAASPLVKSVTFSFDREALTETQMRELERRASGRLLFLPRRHFECFLIDPAAIATFIGKHVPEFEGSLSPDVVSARLRAVGGDVTFRASSQWNGDIFNERWLAKVDAAALIKAVCTELSGSKLEFTKTRHSLELLQHIMANNRAALRGLIEYVEKLFERAQSDAN
ncbi:MAG: AAA family ATPase [Roseiarcus sp.]